MQKAKFILLRALGAFRVLNVMGSMSGPVTTKWSRTRRRVRTVTHSTFRRSPEDKCFGHIAASIRLQIGPLRFGHRSRRKGFAYDAAAYGQFKTYHSNEPSAHVCRRT